MRGSMFFTIFHRETFGNFSNFTFIAAIAVLTFLVPLSAYTQARYYKQLLADHALRKTIHQAENKRDSIVLTRSVPSLLPFYNGAYHGLPDEIIVKNDSVSIQPSSEDLRPLDWLFPETDLGVIIGILMTLMAILLGHDAITSEMERGTMKLILSGPVPRRSVLSAKIAGISLLTTLSLIYVLALYVTGILIFSEGTFKLTAPILAGLLSLLLFSALMLVIFATLGIGISTLVKDSSMALVLSMGVWVVTVLIWPSVGSYVAATMHPVPPKQVSQREIVAKEAEMIQRELARHKEVAAELSNNKTDVESAWQRYLQLRRQWTELKKHEMDTLTSARQRLLRNQESAQRTILALSPYGAFKETLADICGTGIDDYNSFLTSAEKYAWEEYIPASFETLAKQKPWVASSEASTPPQVPVFEPYSRTMMQRLKVIIPPLITLFIETILLIGIGMFSFERYDVR